MELVGYSTIGTLARDKDISRHKAKTLVGVNIFEIFIKNKVGGVSRIGYIWKDDMVMFSLGVLGGDKKACNR